MKPENGKRIFYFLYKAMLRVAAGLFMVASAFTGAAPAGASTACLSSTGSWANQLLPATETGSFRLIYDATPLSTAMDAVSGISYGNANDYTNLAAAVRFNSSGSIDARSGSGFTALNYISYTQGVIYRFTFDVNVTTHTYTVSVTSGSTQKTVGSNLKFRTEQSAAQYLNNVGAVSATGTLRICDVALSTPSTPSSTLVLSASSTNLNFGNVGISAGGVDQNVVLANTGSANVTISKVSVSGAGFVASGSAAGLTLGPKQTTTVRATFDPSATGAASGNLTISSNATNSPVSIALTGTGVAASAHTIWLNWASTSGAVGYNVYVGSTAGGPYSRLNTSTVAGTSYVDCQRAIKPDVLLRGHLCQLRQ